MADARQRSFADRFLDTGIWLLFFAGGRLSYAVTCTQPLFERRSFVFASVVPVVMLN